MTDYKFKAAKRDKKASELRQSGMIPAVIYGKKFENTTLQVDLKEFSLLYREAGSSNLVDLSFGDKSVKSLIHDVQRHPMTNTIIHVDFLKIDMKEKLKTEIPFEFVGETSLVIDQEGSLITSKDTVEVECLPTDLVDHIDVDISVLTEFDMNIKVSDLRVPEGIEILDDPEEVIAIVQPPRSEEELEALDEDVVEDVDAVEVEQAGEEAAEGEDESKQEDKGE